MGADQYILWNIDSSGHWLSQSAVLSGASPAVQSLEPSFHQDLNGDGSIAPTTVIESSGSTTLVQIASAYLIPADDGSLGPQLHYGGALNAPGQFGAWAPIAAEAKAGGYQVAWKMGADQYAVWTTDTNGNMLTNPAGVVSGSSSTLQALEPSFSQDLNGDGTIGVAATLAHDWLV